RSRHDRRRAGDARGLPGLRAAAVGAVFAGRPSARLARRSRRHGPPGPGGHRRLPGRLGTHRRRRVGRRPHRDRRRQPSRGWPEGARAARRTGRERPMTPAPRAPGSSRSHFNLSAAALRFPQLTLFLVLVVAVAGTLAYLRLGQREDPDFTFRAMVVRTMWPGATTEQVDEAVTDRIERKLQET